MESRQAAAQLDFIWTQIVRTDCFRGYRPATVAATGLLGVIAAVAQSFLVPVPQADVQGYLNLWSAVALASLSMTLIEVGLSYLRSDSPLERRLTQRALQQFLPSLLAGGIVTWMIGFFHPENVGLLPGLWSLFFAMGIFASIPFVTPSVIWAANYYLAAGAIHLMWAQTDQALNPLVMGGTFGVGQLLMAALLFFAEVKRDAQA